MVSLRLSDTWQPGEGPLDGVLTPFAVHLLFPGDLKGPCLYHDLFASIAMVLSDVYVAATHLTRSIHFPVEWNVKGWRGNFLKKGSV
jgi:hypothetical protein